MAITSASGKSVQGDLSGSLAPMFEIKTKNTTSSSESFSVQNVYSLQKGVLQKNLTPLYFWEV